MKVSLIISVYRNVRDLKVVLDGLHFQTFKEFEIVVSEDGDSEAMRDFIKNYQHPNTILHLWQEDVGWRKNQALNRAIRECSGDYLIFIDGDCVLHHRFIENHVRYANPSRILAGKRIKLGLVYSEEFRKNISGLLTLEKRILKEMVEVRRDGAKFYEEGIYINPDGLLGFIPRIRKMRHLKGCNMSFFREAIESINGFDEDYILPAVGEDADLAWRFESMNYRLFSLRNLAVQYHLHHNENWVDQDTNLAMMNDKIGRAKARCENGLVKLTET